MLMISSNKITKIYQGVDKIFKGIELVYNASRLPSEYQEVEYIRGTGTQYIVTNYYPKTASKIYVDLITYQKNNEPFQCIFGARDGDALNRCYALFGGGNGNVQGYIGNTGYMQLMLPSTFNPGTRFEIELEAGLLTVNNTKVTGDYTETNNDTPLALFGRNTAGVISNLANMSISKFTIYENNEIKGNYIPCYRKSDNVIGMYDIVTNTFFTNQGTGEFLKGADV